MSKVDYSLYLVTDRKLCGDRSLIKCVEEAILGGVTIVQLREKDVTSREFYTVAMEVKKITDKYNVPLIINDRIDIALAIDACGVHIGQEDLSCELARKLLSSDKIVGVSAHNIEEAKLAELQGANYVGCGSVFKTSTKDNVEELGVDKLKEIKENVSIPVVAIGGINEKNIELLYGSNVDGVAVVSAIISKEGIQEVSKDLKNKIIKFKKA